MAGAFKRGTVKNHYTHLKYEKMKQLLIIMALGAIYLTSCEKTKDKSTPSVLEVLTEDSGPANPTPEDSVNTLITEWWAALRDIHAYLAANDSISSGYLVAAYNFQGASLAVMPYVGENDITQEVIDRFSTVFNGNRAPGQTVVLPPGCVACGITYGRAVSNCPRIIIHYNAEGYQGNPPSASEMACYYNADRAYKSCWGFNQCSIWW